MIESLTCDINRRIYMSYGPRQRCPESRAAQSGSRLVTRVRASTRSHRASRPGLLHLPAPSLSLPRTGSATQATRTGRRRETVLHRQTFSQSDRQTPRLCCFHRIDLERNRHPCLLGGTASRGRSWLTGREVGNERYGWNINLIVCCQRNWRERMNCSCPPETGLQPEPPPNRLAAIRRF
jgi:hypothetical protein